jgi:hypothetical protein
MDYRKLLHGEQRFSYHAMAYAGDKLTFEQRIEDIYDKKGGLLEFVVRETRVTNQTRPTHCRPARRDRAAPRLRGQT